MRPALKRRYTISLETNRKNTMNPIQLMLLLFIRLYRLVLSPLKNALFGATGSCRFSPSCSMYTLEAIKLHGSIKGSLLGLHRILRCNPWGNHGHDPVPTKRLSFRASKIKN